MNLKNQKGVTLATLTIYLIVSAVLLGTLAFVNANFMSELGELTKRSKMTNEMLKFYSFFVNDVKSANNVLEFSDSYVRFDNGTQYSVKYRANKKDGENQAYDIYEVYRGNALITDKLSGVFFEYSPEYNFIKVKLTSMVNNAMKQEEHYYRVGRGY